jgi:hypothetical protein
MGSSLTIGRNRECRIRDIKCSRNYCSISFTENQIICKYIKSGLTQKLSNGHLLSGPGFQYKIVIINNNNSNYQQINYQKNDSNEEQLSQESNDDVFSYKSLVKPLVSDSSEKSF